jgi:hypothetical protein
MRTMFIYGVLAGAFGVFVAVGLLRTILDRNTSQKKAALCGAWLAGLAVALVATAVSLPN